MKSIEKYSIGIVGLGQIGGSFAASLRQRKPACKLIGFDINPFLTNIAVKQSIIDSSGSDEIDIINNSEILILALPISTIIKALNKYHGILKNKSLIVDLGSIREPVQKAVIKNRYLNHIGIHTICGTALKGHKSWNPDLFKNASCYIFHRSVTLKRAVLLAKQLVKAIGGKIEQIDYQKHDRVFAVTSGLPHIFAFLMNKMWNDLNVENSSLKGPSFNSSTRVVSSDPEMVTQLLYNNRLKIVKSMKKLEEKLNDFKLALSEDNFDYLKKTLIRYGKMSKR